MRDEHENAQENEDRQERRARLISPSFSLTGHLVGFSALTGIGIAVGAWLARAARPGDLWIVPTYIVLANFVEYLVHRFPMHRPVFPRVFYRNHTLGHHRVFHHHSMEIGHWREIQLVVMPWFTIGVFFAALAPVTFAMASWQGRGAAGVFALTSVATFILYEGMHALYHLPERVLRRLRVWPNRAFQFLYGHHRHHHRLVRMRWVNFNISLPLADWVLGTLESERQWQLAYDRRKMERAPRPKQKKTSDADPEAA